MSLQHFLLIFDHDQQRLLQTPQAFKDALEAIAAYAAAEKEFAERKNLEIVLIGSDSLKTVQRTHANYFEPKEAKSRFLTGV